MATILDVAKHAGVSISTVSNTLNKSKYVSDDLVNRVNKSVNELNYIKDSVASNMKRGYTKTIGVITSDICGLFYPYVLKGIYEIINKYGYSLTIYDSHVTKDEDNIKKEEESFKHLFSNKVDGIIFVSSISKNKESCYLNKLIKESNILKKTPLVSLERDFSKYGIDSVFYDNIETAKKAINHLIKCKCKKIAFIGGPIGEQLPEERKQGYLKSIHENGLIINKNMITNGDYTHISGYNAMNYLLDKNKNIDGVYAANDQMAIGALKAIKERKIKIPEEIKLIGTDDVFVSSIVEPAISTVHIRKRHMGKRAAQILIQRIDEIMKKNRKIKDIISEEIEIKLVIRKSTDNSRKDKIVSVDW